ncbi:hypothetical protein GO988_18205 [Hymenobacter sp. HMF4947]|uniref:Resolvase HTH domain-containing protein n=1 Tax=Hymenobacter ginkgonis TaxID=2682976 RepID=A0A7K1TIN2_9BACT|nr:hypothetical protein [Hymenobacter ginkgonis]MVN78267.1 hypothetical protein [Hymenobacter ginkgonis]
MAKQHRGEVVKEAVLKSGVKITKLYQELGISRPTLYRRFEEPNLSFAFIEQVGALIRHDFAQDFRELAPPVGSAVAEPTPAYQLDTLDDCKNKLLHVYALYTELQEKYAALLAERSK